MVSLDKVESAGAAVASSTTSATPGDPSAGDDHSAPWHRKNLPTTVLVVALFGFCFGFFPTVSVLLNELVKQNRFELANIGTAYMLLVLCQGFGSMGYGMMSKMESHRTALFWSFIAAAFLFFVMVFASGNAMLLLFALLGLPIGVMLTIAVAGLVSFGGHAVRMQGFNAITMRTAQLAIIVTLSTVIVPYFAAAGGFIFLALIYLGSAFLWPLFFVDRFATVHTEGSRARFSIGMRGAVALVAGLLIFGGRGALVPYVVPLGEAMGLDIAAARQGMSVFVAAQLTGAVIVCILSFGGRYLAMLTASTIVILTTSAICAFSPSSTIFYLGIFAMALALSVKDVFVLPMIMSADPSHRAALQMGSTSLFGEALGPFAAVALLSTAGVRGSLIVMCSMIFTGMVLVYGLEISKARTRG